jgi:hypothetical protein
MKYTIPNIGSCHFTYELWKGFSSQTFEISIKYFDIVSPRGKRILRQYAVGWCNAQNVPCRPKVNEFAVMFYKEGEHFWFHLRKNEFQEVFGET